MKENMHFPQKSHILTVPVGIQVSIAQIIARKVRGYGIVYSLIILTFHLFSFR
jgi:hypothetical protein